MFTCVLHLYDMYLCCVFVNWIATRTFAVAGTLFSFPRSPPHCDFFPFSSFLLLFLLLLLRFPCLSQRRSPFLNWVIKLPPKLVAIHFAWPKLTILTYDWLPTLTISCFMAFCSCVFHSLVFRPFRRVTLINIMFIEPYQWHHCFHPFGSN